ncbi:hypothetical protein [Pantoea sp. SS70]|uniref:hypothetical protein n=1 Tax=Pantoea sp. SS70 TaxID=3024247 RepID=UPI00245290B3|nr:hypothetical protein [Pantoea sp. SS70]WGK57783.1 hypothetical protein PO881_02780 [Pantoea sp. SS70]
MNKEWFELKDARRKDWNKSVWITLRAINTISEKGKIGHLGYESEFFGLGSAAFPLEQIDKIKKLGWSDIGISHEHAGYVDGDDYIPCDIFCSSFREVEGLNLVIEQKGEGDFKRVWYLHPDLITTLGLYREGDVWICPREGYEEVVRVSFREEKPVSIEIKSKYLKDYLCARGLFLYLTAFYSRESITEDDVTSLWSDEENNINDENLRWEGRVIPIHEGGHPFGSKMSVFHVFRTDVEEDDELPDLSSIPSDNNTHSEQWEKTFEGRKLYRILGELWKDSIVNPSQQSRMVRGDKIPSSIYFVVDLEGTRLCGDELIESGKWLWFKPDVMSVLSKRRGGELNFYSRYTGGVACYDGYNTHFGVNELGLINVYAKDIGLLPEWQQQIWAGYNCSPEGGISKELYMSQVRAEPAESQSPEEFFPVVLNELNKKTQDLFGFNLFRDHESIPEIIKSINRFRSLDEASFYDLAKDLARVIADNIDASAIQKVVAPPKGEKWGSLKSLEKLLTSRFDNSVVRKVTAPLVGIYELRHADAHLPSSKIEEAFKLIEIDRSLPFVVQGEQMLHIVVSALYMVLEGFKQWHGQDARS